MKRVLIALPLIAIAGVFDLESLSIPIAIMLFWPVKNAIIPARSE
jgi:hypothetical protein